MTKNKLLTAGMMLYCAAVCVGFAAMGMPAEATEILEMEEPKVTVRGMAQVAAPVKADTLVHITQEKAAPMEYLDEMVEYPEVNTIENCIITYYCCEKRAHICGTGDGLTATGTEATPGRTCAVDPSVIPYGSMVMIDYGEGELHTYIAEDAGAWVNQAHVDVCVASHDEALAMGRKNATVYWLEPEDAAV